MNLDVEQDVSIYDNANLRVQTDEVYFWLTIIIICNIIYSYEYNHNNQWLFVN